MMSEKKWTSGPWMSEVYTHTDKSGVSIDIDLEVRSDIGTLIYQRDLGFAGDDDERLANANLIAAAPDLYEALKDMVDAVEYLMNEGEGNKETAEARAALAKARGEA